MEFSDSEFDDMLDSMGMEPGSTVVGVARLCMEQGYAFLTPKQKAIYDAYVKPRLEEEARRKAQESGKPGGQ